MNRHNHRTEGMGASRSGHPQCERHDVLRQPQPLSKSQRLALRFGIYFIGLFWSTIVTVFTMAPCFAAVFNLGRFSDPARPLVALSGLLASSLAGWFLLWRGRRQCYRILMQSMVWWYERITKQKYPGN
jgi:hypothetical protein